MDQDDRSRGEAADPTRDLDEGELDQVSGGTQAPAGGLVAPGVPPLPIGWPMSSLDVPPAPPVKRPLTDEDAISGH